MPSFNLNREVFDADLAELNLQQGTKFIDAKVVSVELGTGGQHHEVTYASPSGPETIRARWVVDASGRGGILAKKLSLRRKVKYQRSCFWFRMDDFDPNIMSKFELVKRENRTFDSYNCTHHLFGRGNWIWLIPMTSDRPRSRISVGITWRPDKYPWAQPIRNVADFLSAVEHEHPLVAEFTRSGRIMDTSVYLNYMYDSERYYSRDGWFLVGDAGRCYDPLFSTGLLYIATQATQVAAMIKKDQESSLTDAYVDGLDAIFKGFTNYSYNAVSLMYDHMHDPVRTAWDIFQVQCNYFYALLPMLCNGWQTDAGLRRALSNMSAEPTATEINPLFELAAHVADRKGPTREVMGFDTSQLTLDRTLRGPTDRTPSTLFSRMLRRRAQLRFQLLRHARADVAAINLARCAREFASSASIHVLGKFIKREPGNLRPFDFVDRELDGEPSPPFWPGWKKPAEAHDTNGSAHAEPAPVTGEDMSLPDPAPAAGGDAR